MLKNNGKDYHYIPALNNNAEWINAMDKIINPHLLGWINNEWSNAEEKKYSKTTKKQFNIIKKENKQ